MNKLFRGLIFAVLFLGTGKAEQNRITPYVYSTRMVFKNPEEKSLGIHANFSVGYWRMMVNLLAASACLAATILIFCTKWAIDVDVYVQEEYSQLSKYLYLTVALLFLVMTIFTFSLVLDMSVFYKIRLLNDLRDWYIAELACLLGYTIEKKEDPLRRELEQYKQNHLASIDSYEEMFIYHRQTKPPTTMPTAQQEETLSEIISVP